MQGHIEIFFKNNYFFIQNRNYVRENVFTIFYYPSDSENMFMNRISVLYENTAFEI